MEKEHKNQMEFWLFLQNSSKRFFALPHNRLLIQPTRHKPLKKQRKQKKNEKTEEEREERKGAREKQTKKEKEWKKGALSNQRIISSHLRLQQKLHQLSCSSPPSLNFNYSPL